MMKQHCSHTWRAQSATTALIGLLLAFVLLGCASLPPNLVSTGAVTVERIDSSKAEIGSLYVGGSNGRLVINGRLEKRYEGRSPIPGHVQIQMLAKDGAILEEAYVRHYRHNPESGASYFSQEFGVRPQDVRTVRVIHHIEDEDERIADHAA